MVLWCEEIYIWFIMNLKRLVGDLKDFRFKFLLGKDIWMRYLIYNFSLFNYKIELVMV